MDDRMNKILSIAIFAILVLAATALQVNAYQYCMNGTWLGENITIVDNGVINTYHQLEYCPYGCDSNERQCNPSNWQAYTGPAGNWGILGLLAFIIIVFLLVIILINRAR